MASPDALVFDVRRAIASVIDDMPDMPATKTVVSELLSTFEASDVKFLHFFWRKFLLREQNSDLDLALSAEVQRLININQLSVKLSDNIAVFIGRRVRNYFQMSAYQPKRAALFSFLGEKINLLSDATIGAFVVVISVPLLQYLKTNTFDTGKQQNV